MANPKQGKGPWSPVGYRVVQMSAETTAPRPAQPPPLPPPLRIAKPRPPTRRKKPPLVYWTPIVGASLFMLAFLVTVVVAARSGPASPAEENPGPVAKKIIPVDLPPEGDIVPEPQDPVEIPEAPVPELAPAEPPVPPAPPDLPPVQAEAPPIPPETNLVKDIPPPDRGQEKVCQEPVVPVPEKEQLRPGRETFGTQVEFVRNPDAANDLARKEKKLAFLLHVSGNFEDAEFT